MEDGAWGSLSFVRSSPESSCSAIFHSNKEEGEKKKEEAHLVLSDPALAPDEDGLHLRAQGLLSGDPQLDGQAGVGSYTSTFGIPGQRGMRQED